MTENEVICVRIMPFRGSNRLPNVISLFVSPDLRYTGIRLSRNWHQMDTQKKKRSNSRWTTIAGEPKDPVSKKNVVGPV